MTFGEGLDLYEQDVGKKNAAYARRYLEAGGTERDQSLTKYLAELEDSGLKRGTVDRHRAMVQAFFRYADKLLRDRGSFGIHVPEARGWHYDAEHESRKVALDSSLIGLLIAAAKDGTLTARQMTLLCLSTVYAMRTVEMASIQQQDVDREGQRIFIRTAKGGVWRWCWLPPQIQSYLQEDWAPTTAGAVQKAFTSIWGQVIERKRPPRTAWHAIRHALHRDLEAAGVSESDRTRFGRWRTGTQSMAQSYVNVTVNVTAEGEAPARQEGDEGSREFDAAVWAAHPWLGLWR